ncbi:cysteine desulfurase family protein [Flavobacterium sp.]|uniref:cysteine desulfurase family protein n=1 Tax=Flavobacterium sp. TaxID=239 RepID=UPI00260EDBD0|nr:cysteine desulfurase family protein [Flavobacterium sp.]MDD3003835.1 cysteine desulfurase family protein [Flavobacterium sp.]
MEKIYLDNAATTALRPEVATEMLAVLQNEYGNPSSSHSFGRSAKSKLELSRKTIAQFFKVSSQEIIFTSGATEANNWVLQNAVVNLGVKRIITSPIEHHAVLHVVEVLQKTHNIQVDYIKIKSDGTIDINHLVELLAQDIATLVSLMHVNNEIGTVTDLDQIAQICKQHSVYFHSDTVQSVGKERIDLQKTPVDFMVASAHKFHGPKGVGFLFVRKGISQKPLFYGGEQEKGIRPGTESLHNIVGMSKALQLAYEKLDEDREYIQNLKKYTIQKLQHHFPEVQFNGNENQTFYTILNVRLPLDASKSAMILFNLDMKGFAVSRGSACQSGSPRPSHVLEAFLDETNRAKPSIRISFSHFNTQREIDLLMEALLAL